MDIFYYLLSFFIIINLIVFTHEFGHYYAAKKVGVKVTTFSIGMGPELFGFSDKNGTRWRFSALPIGGYVMMLGDGDISSTTENEDDMQALNEDEKKLSIFAKNNWEKMFIAFAGPFVNYIYAFVVIVVMAFSVGVPKYDTTIGSILENSAADKAGLLAGDKIVSINGKSVLKYRDVLLSITNTDDAKLQFIVERNKRMLQFNVFPEIKDKKRLLGGTKKVKIIGIKAANPVFEKLSFINSIKRAFSDCISSTLEMGSVFLNLFAGKKSLDDFGGIVHMATVAGELSKNGDFFMLIMFTVTLSLNLGFINLLPLPVLDGGRILTCFLEQVTGKKLDKKLQEYIMMIFAILLIILMFLTTVNDILRINVINDFFDKILG